MRRRALAAAAAVTLAMVVAAAPASPARAASSGTVTVPLDWAHPAAGTTHVAYRLIARRDRSAPARSTILYNPGDVP
ncbi:MAG: hypothetical protein QOJ85_1811 [Solirubrobacteraceae bacterium]|jgi:hypothetical protein|nr:hypothetical protein [Solirubrobacteraceae bacterium]MEA2242033.1 hypothetical protein [Solirubrobacteraceae bacterium]